MPEAGDDVVLRLSNRDHKEIQAKYGKRWLTIFIAEMMAGDNDIVMLEEIARLAAKDKDGAPVKLAEDVFDKMTVVEFGKRVMDAIMVSVHGQTFKEYMEAAVARQEEAAEDGDVPPGKTPDMTTLMTSEASASEAQESASTNSGE